MAIDDYFDTAQDPAVEGESALFEALSRRRRRSGLTLSPDNLEQLVLRVQRDFNDALAVNTAFRDYHREYYESWRGVPVAKDYPFEGAHNIRVPCTSTFVEQTKARLYKALFSGDMLCRFTRLDESITDEELDEVNQWFKWELDQVVQIRNVARKLLHDVCVDGIAVGVPSYAHRERRIFETREFDIANEQDLQSQMLQIISSTFGPEAEPIAQAVGWWKVTHEVPGGEYSQADIRFLVEEDTLIAEIERQVVIFDGVEVTRVDIEDLVVINSAEELDKLPFFGYWGFISLHDFVAGLNSGYFRKMNESDKNSVIAHASNKIHTQAEQQKERSADTEEGTQSRDISGVDYSRRWVEFFYWEGWWSNDMGADGKPTGDEVPIAVWFDPRSRIILKVARLSELSPDGQRTPVKFDLIKQPGRFYSIGLVEWLRHIQAELDAIHNQRLDAGLIQNVPWGFYVPTAGNPPQILSLKPGSMYPIKDPNGVVFPKTNWNPQWSFQEEGNVRQYAQEQAGLGDPQIGSFISKRASASEFMATSGAADIRTEFIVDDLIESFRKLFYKIFQLYKAYAEDGRIFQVSGRPGEVVVKRFDRDLLQQKMTLQLSGNSQQISAQLERDVSLNMLSLLLNNVLIQMGIVKPDTIYAAVNKVVKAMNYSDVPLYRPDFPKPSPEPEIEHKILYAGKPIQASPMDNHNEHLASHVAFASDPNIAELLPDPAAQRMLVDHIQQHMNLQQAAMLLRQQQAAMATEMQNGMRSQGIQPGMEGGEMPGDNMQPATPEEGLNVGATFGPETAGNA